LLLNQEKCNFIPEIKKNNMKTVLWISATVCMLLAACNSGQENATENEENSVKSETEEVSKTIENPKSKTPNGISAWPDDVQEGEEYKVTAYFERVVAGTDGAIFIFVDPEGNEYELWEEGDFTSGLKFTRELPPNKPVDKYKNQWHELVFQIRERSFYDGGTGETNVKLVPVVKSFKKLDEEDTKLNAVDGIVDYQDVKPGDVIEGHTVKSKDYETGHSWRITFSDAFEVSGNVYQNQMSDQYEMKVNPDELPETSILVDGKEYNMYKRLIIATHKDFSSLLSEDVKEQLEAGKQPNVRLKVENLVIGHTVDKSRLNTGLVELIQVVN